GGCTRRDLGDVSRRRILPQPQGGVAGSTARAFPKAARLDRAAGAAAAGPAGFGVAEEVQDLARLGAGERRCALETRARIERGSHALRLRGLRGLGLLAHDDPFEERRSEREIRVVDEATPPSPPRASVRGPARRRSRTRRRIARRKRRTSARGGRTAPRSL